jgi:hypothetical protein
MAVCYSPDDSRSVAPLRERRKLKANVLGSPGGPLLLQCNSIEKLWERVELFGSLTKQD